MVTTSNAVQPARPMATSSIGLGPVPPAASSNNMWCPLPDVATNCRSDFSGCESCTFALIIMHLLKANTSINSIVKPVQIVTDFRAFLLMSPTAGVDPQDGPCRAILDEARNQCDGAHNVCDDCYRSAYNMKKSQAQQGDPYEQPNSSFPCANVFRHGVFPFSRSSWNEHLQLLGLRFCNRMNKCKKVKFVTESFFEFARLGEARGPTHVNQPLVVSKPLIECPL